MERNLIKRIQKKIFSFKGRFSVEQSNCFKWSAMKHNIIKKCLFIDLMLHKYNQCRVKNFGGDLGAC